MIIKLVDLTRKFRIGSSEITAVDKANAEIDEGRFISVVGPSGSGKSTLMNLLGLNDYPTYGKILINGTDVSILSSGERRKLRLHHMGFVFQTINLLPTLSALENVELPMDLARKSAEEQRKKAVKLLETVGLQRRLHHRPKELSIGEMQRVAIARALANDPEIVIADEPTGELDSKTAKEIIDLIYALNRTHKTTVIVATHDEKMVKVSDEIYTIHDGKLKHRKK